MLNVPDKTVERRVAAGTAWIVTGPLFFTWYIHDAMDLPGNKTTNIARISHSRDNSVSFVMILCPRKRLSMILSAS